MAIGTYISRITLNENGLNAPVERHILIKLTKIKHKERILKAARENQQWTYKENAICFLTADLSAETL